MNTQQRSYLWRCDTTKLTFAVLAYSEGQAKRWFSRYAKGPSSYLGLDTRQDGGYTTVLASLDQHGQPLYPAIDRLQTKSL